MVLESRKRQSIIYFLSLLLSGLLYSFMTGKLLQFEGMNSFLILLLASFVDLLLIVLLRRTQLIQQLPVFIYPLGALLGIIISVFLGQLTGTVGFYLVLYTYLSILISSLLMVYQEKILESEQSLTSGFFTVQLLRNGSKMLGFFLGILLSQFGTESLFRYLLMGGFFVTAWLTLLQKDRVEVVAPQAGERIRGWLAYPLSGIFGTAIVLWIPLLTKAFIADGFEMMSWLPFVLPGILSITVIQLQKRYRQLYQSLFPEYMVLVLFGFFFFLRYMQAWPLLQVGIFSLLTALLLSVGIKVRTYFLKQNSEIDVKYVLQTLTVNSSLFTIAFSLLGSEGLVVEGLLFLACVLGLVFMIWKRAWFV